MTEPDNRCANQSSEKGGPKCPNKATTGHIFCDPCRLQTGGYQRYNPPAINKLA